jgi:hypothetical protein
MIAEHAVAETLMPDLCVFAFTSLYEALLVAATAFVTIDDIDRWLQPSRH